MSQEHRRGGGDEWGTLWYVIARYYWPTAGGERRGG